MIYWLPSLWTVDLLQQGLLAHVFKQMITMIGFMKPKCFSFSKGEITVVAQLCSAEGKAMLMGLEV